MTEPIAQAASVNKGAALAETEPRSRRAIRTVEFVSNAQLGGATRTPFTICPFTVQARPLSSMERFLWFDICPPGQLRQTKRTYNWVREERSSVRQTWRKCHSTVCSLTKSRAAISRFEAPPITCMATCGRCSVSPHASESSNAKSVRCGATTIAVAASPPSAASSVIGPPPVAAATRSTFAPSSANPFSSSHSRRVIRSLSRADKTRLIGKVRESTPKSRWPPHPIAPSSGRSIAVAIRLGGNDVLAIARTSARASAWSLLRQDLRRIGPKRLSNRECLV